MLDNLVNIYVKNEKYRRAMGLPKEMTEEYSLYAKGEYNANYIFTHPIDDKKYLLRVNLGSQMNLENQIEYESKALKALSNSNRTPRVYFTDGSKEFIDYGVLVMEFLNGEVLDYNNLNDILGAMECLSDIHSQTVDKSDFIEPQDSLGAVLDECEEMFSIYYNSDLADVDVKQKIRKMLDRAHEISKEESAALSYKCLINTELNSTNFLSERFSDFSRVKLIDWEKPIYGDPAQDLGHFLAPTTTFWKTDVIFSESQIDEYINMYIQAVGDRFDLTGFKERTKQFIRITCLRGLTWCAMAWVQYKDPNKINTNQSTRIKLDQYLADDFLEKIRLFIN